MLKKFVVYEDKWLQGNPDNKDTVLLNSDGERCCLGFVAGQCGIPDSALLGVGEIRCLPEEYWQLLPEALRPGRKDEANVITLWDADLANEAYSVNDDSLLSLAQRERNLNYLMRGYGFEFTFKLRELPAGDEGGG